MTRFKELRRIEAAVAHQNKDELNWSENYCKMRIRLAPNRREEKHWETLLKKVGEARTAG